MVSHAFTSWDTQVGLAASDNHRSQSRDLYGMTEEEKNELRTIRQQLLREKAEREKEDNMPRTSGRRWRSTVKSAPPERGAEKLPKPNSPQVKLSPKLAMSVHARQVRCSLSLYIYLAMPARCLAACRRTVRAPPSSPLGALTALGGSGRRRDTHVHIHAPGEGSLPRGSRCARVRGDGCARARS